MGPISEKENFVKLVQARKMLDEEQLQECIAAWEKVSIQGGDRKIWDIACDLGYLTKNQHGRIDAPIVRVEHGHLEVAGRADALRNLLGGRARVAQRLRVVNHRNLPLPHVLPPTRVNPCHQPVNSLLAPGRNCSHRRRKRLP